MILTKIGLALILLGLFLVALTFFLAKKNGSFEAIKELNRIRTAGYTKEHQEERTEDVFRPNPTAGQARLMSRRAKRVLERMEQPESEEKEISTAPGTMHLEEVKRFKKRERKETGVKTTSNKASRIEQPLHQTEKTSPLKDSSAKEQAAALSSEEKTAPLKEETSRVEQTAALTSLDATAALYSDKEISDSLRAAYDEQTAALEETQQTAPLNMTIQAMVEKTGVLEDETLEGTAVLKDAADTDAEDLIASEDASSASEATEALIESDLEDTAVLDDY